jgi:hypothetical protein
VESAYIARIAYQMRHIVTPDEIVLVA